MQPFAKDGCNHPSSVTSTMVTDGCIQRSKELENIYQGVASTRVRLATTVGHDWL
jgi:hypothetical protein